MKKFFFLLVILTPFCLFAQKDGKIGIYTVTGNSNWGKGYQVIYWVEPETNELYVKNNQLKYGDIITHVNGIDIYRMDNTEFTNLCRGSVGSEVELTILRMGKIDPIKINIKRKKDIGVPGEFHFANYIINKDKYSGDGIRRLTNNNNSVHQVQTDKEVDFLKYRTFDFEYTNQKQPLIEKELASIIEGILESKGLRRDKENPDILVFINFFSDKKEQYVPPTEQFSTRYKTVYNMWTKSYETRQYLESQTQGDYTKTEYLTLLEIAFMDAKKAKDGNNKVPPLIWNATYEYATNAKTTLINEAKVEYPLLLNSYPLISYQIDIEYDDWGLYVDNKSRKIITGFKLNSYAESLGLKEGDILKFAEVEFVCVGGNSTKQRFSGDPIFEIYSGQRWSKNDYCFLSTPTKIGVELSKNGKIKTFKFQGKPSKKRIIMSLPIE